MTRPQQRDACPDHKGGASSICLCPHQVKPQGWASLSVPATQPPPPPAWSTRRRTRSLRLLGPLPVSCVWSVILLLFRGTPLETEVYQGIVPSAFRVQMTLGQTACPIPEKALAPRHPELVTPPLGFAALSGDRHPLGCSFQWGVLAKMASAASLTETP